MNSAARPDARPAPYRPAVGAILASTWRVGTAARQRAAVEAIRSTWEKRDWPDPRPLSCGLHAGTGRRHAPAPPRPAAPECRPRRGRCRKRCPEPSSSRSTSRGRTPAGGTPGRTRRSPHWPATTGPFGAWRDRCALPPVRGRHPRPGLHRGGGRVGPRRAGGRARPARRVLAAVVPPSRAGRQPGAPVRARAEPRRGHVTGHRLLGYGRKRRTCGSWSLFWSANSALMWTLS